MAANLGKWPSNRGLISKIRPSDGCKGDTVPSTVVRGYDLRKLGGHLGNVGSDASPQAVAKMRADEPGTASHQNSFTTIVYSRHFAAPTI